MIQCSYRFVNAYQGGFPITHALTLCVLPAPLTVCKLPLTADLSALSLDVPFYVGRTESEFSLVCPTSSAPSGTIAREDGWRGFTVLGTLDFSLIGILADISTVLARENISIFALSTYDTDTVLVKAENLASALSALEKAGYIIQIP